MSTLLTTYKASDNSSIKLLYGRLGNRLFLISQNFDVNVLRNLAKKYQGYDGFELRSGRGQIVEKWEYLKYGQEETDAAV